MPDSSSSIEWNQNLPDSVWQIGSEEGQIEPASIDVEGLTPETFEELVDGFKTVAHAARRHIGDEVNRTQLLSYWIDGRMIVSAGAGNPARMPRWGNPPEILMIDLD